MTNLKTPFVVRFKKVLDHIKRLIKIVFQNSHAVHDVQKVRWLKLGMQCKDYELDVYQDCGANSDLWDLFQFLFNLKIMKKGTSYKTYIIIHYNPIGRYSYTYLYNWSLQPYQSGLLTQFFTKLTLCVLILYISGGTYSLTSPPNDRFFGKVFMAILFTFCILY